MKNIVTTILLLSLIVVACDKDEEYESITEISEYVFADNGYNHDSPLTPPQIETDNVITIVRNKKDFNNIFSSYSSLTPINFSISSMLLISDFAPNGVIGITSEINEKENEKGKYIVSVDVSTDMTCAFERWSVAYIVPKTIKSEDIELQVNYK